MFSLNFLSILIVVLVFWHKVIQEVTKNKDFTYNHALETYGMASEEVFLPAACALGQTLVYVLGTLATCKR